MRARIQGGWRQLVKPGLLAQTAHLPYHIVGNVGDKPRLQHPADAEAPVLTSEEAPRALQLAPELHEAFLVILNTNHIIFFFLNTNYTNYTNGCA